jgi:hypothetical protein
VILAVALAALLVGAEPALAQGQTRQYYVAAEEVTWDFAPSRKALIHGHGPSEAIPKPWARNTRKKKVRYVEYTDSTFTTPKPQPEWLGILGPVIRAEVGDIIVVHFLNRAKGRYDLTWRRLKRGASPQDFYLTIATGLSGTPMPYLGGSFDSRQIWGLVDFLDSLVPAEHRVADGQDDGRHDGRLHDAPDAGTSVINPSAIVSRVATTTRRRSC